MKLTYRGVPYNGKNQNLSTPLVVIQNKKLIYRGNSTKARINPKFPWWKFIKQLFSRAESQSIFDPITFWYEHKRVFLEDSWRLVDVEKLDRCWDFTLQIERNKALKPKEKNKLTKLTKLKYRGVTYYR